MKSEIEASDAVMTEDIGEILEDTPGAEIVAKADEKEVAPEVILEIPTGTLEETPEAMLVAS